MLPFTIRILPFVFLLTLHGVAQAQPTATPRRPSHWATSVYESARASVVRVESSLRGTGFVYGDRRHIATAFHVVEDPRSVLVITTDGRKLSARVIAANQYDDLAILEVDEDAGQPLTPKLEAPLPGTPVLAIGHPLFRESKGRRKPLPWTSQQGIVSGSDEHFVQTDVRATFGSSGGPLLDADGKLVGICSAKKDVLVFFARSSVLDELWRSRHIYSEYTGRTKGRLGFWLSCAQDDRGHLWGFGLHTGVNMHNTWILTLRGGYHFGSESDLGPSVVSSSRGRWTTGVDVTYRLRLGAGVDLDLGPGITWNRETLTQRLLRSDANGNWSMLDEESTRSEFLPTLATGLKVGRGALQFIWTPRIADEDYAAGMINLVFMTTGG